MRMADLLGRLHSHSHRAVFPSPSSFSTTNLHFSASSSGPSPQHLVAPFNPIELPTLTALIPQAHTQLQNPSPTTPDEGIKWWERDLGATLGDVHSTQELTDVIENADGKLVVVEFFASWCGSCRALYPKLCKLAKEHQDIVFVKVNFDENKAFCKSMNIKVLPYFHLYQGELKDSFSCSLTKLQKLKDAIAKFRDGNHLMDDAERTDPKHLHHP